MSLPTAIIPILAHFAPAFTAPTWRKAQLLLLGVLLAHGRRTVASALRATGHAADPAFACYHHVLNRAVWSSLRLSHLLLLLLLATFPAPTADLTFVVDEHLERRWGPRIAKRGHYRDPARSSRGHAVSSSGLRWLVVALVVPLPWTPFEVALPFLTILLTPPAVDAAAGRRHKTHIEWTCQVVRLLRRWLPARSLWLIGDGAYGVLDLAALCVQEQVTLLAPLPPDASLYAPAPPRAQQASHKPRVIGARLPSAATVLADPATEWTTLPVPWYREGPRLLRVTSQRVMWYRGGKVPVPLRYVIARDPAGRTAPRIYFATVSDAPTAQRMRATRADRARRARRRAARGPLLRRAPVVPARAVPVVPVTPELVAAAPAAPPVARSREEPPDGAAGARTSAGWAEETAADAQQAALDLLGRYQRRWPIEVSFEEARAYLGVNTQRQWSDAAIARSTPALLGLYSLVHVLAQALHPDGQIPVAQAAWYPKTVATFSDLLGTVRRHLWSAAGILQGGDDPQWLMLPRVEYDRLLAVACSGAD